MAKKYQMALDAKAMIKDQSLLRHEDIKQHIHILPELAAYIPPLLPDEYKQLEENIIQNGCREALLVWETTGEHIPDLETTATAYILIDGHNRYAICHKHNIDFKVHLMNFPSLEQVKFFMIDNQLGRRNLAPEQVSYLRGLRYLREKQEKGKYSRDNQKGQNDLYELKVSKGLNDNGPEIVGEGQQTTANRLGKQFNVSEKTIKRDAAYAQGLEQLAPAFKQDILSGKTKIDKALVQQLGQTDLISEPITNVVELEQVIQQKQKKSQSSTTVQQSKKKVLRDQLKQQLQKLVIQLDEKRVNVNQVCNDIIECARKLQEEDK
jgi:hypothetical protein